ncbi:MAG: VCBS repeat-containing protein, partial [Pirellulaceae bacterium]
WEQQAPAADGTLAWKKHLIDDSFSQPRALHMADLTGDKKLELITGKRVFAHNGKDPGGKLPPCIFYYTWDAATAKFTRQVIDLGHVGTGLQIRTADLDQDGRVDIAVAGKSGTYILWNKGF